MSEEGHAENQRIMKLSVILTNVNKFDSTKPLDFPNDFRQTWLTTVPAGQVMHLWGGGYRIAQLADFQ